MNKHNQATCLYVAADSLCLIRLAASSVIGNYVENTPREERSLKAGVVVAAVWSTDAVDGWLSRKGDRIAQEAIDEGIAAPNPGTRLGKLAHLAGKIAANPVLRRNLDNGTDKRLTTKVLKAQADTGEISSRYWKQRLFRDVTVSAIRFGGERNGVNTAALSMGKTKTELDAAQQIGAVSGILSPVVSEVMASTANNLSNVSGLDYLIKFRPKEPVNV
jgi:phosphatidylglycerophosphate synthase